MDRNKVIIIGLSVILLVVIILGVFFGCSACSLSAERKRLAALEAERLAVEEAARLEAERLEAERLEAERLEAERLAAEAAEAARLEAERLEAERLAAEARRRAAAGSASTSTYHSTETDPNNAFVGVWANNTQTVVFRCRPNGDVEVLNYVCTDEAVEVYWRTNRALTGGGFYDTRNPEIFESTYTGTGTYTVNRDSVSFRLNMRNHLGTTKTVNHTTRFTMNNEKDTVRLTSGLARRFIINKETREVFNTKDYVNSFTRQ